MNMIPLICMFVVFGMIWVIAFLFLKDALEAFRKREFLDCFMLILLGVGSFTLGSFIVAPVLELVAKLLRRLI